MAEPTPKPPATKTNVALGAIAVVAVALASYFGIKLPDAPPPCPQCPACAPTVVVPSAEPAAP